ncbi:sporulation peptidase YabG [Phosphitispora sp. TUW77]|uniref:sporulation peptidase YabG n=1 Tax=Phosphitispora sp. TUW77 TaxID=3152361 RepID=UPI003AB38AFA
MEIKVGDIVARKSYNNDIYFKVNEVIETDSGEVRVKLLGLDVRLFADSPVEDLVKVDADNIREYRKKFIRTNNNCLKRIIEKRLKERGNDLFRSGNKIEENFFEIPGRVLHIDGNLEYLNLCMAIYGQLGIPAKGANVPEGEQPASVPGLIKKCSPDILVLTGHDGIIRSGADFTDLNNYHNSRYFVKAVKAARFIECNMDNLIIFAGACQSHYEALLQAGANYASAPQRVMIHAFDPVFIVEKVAFTSFNKTIATSEVIENTITGIEGLGGIETRGKLRRGFPKSPY